jgi:hypothetical protein
LPALQAFEWIALSWIRAAPAWRDRLAILWDWDWDWDLASFGLKTCIDLLEVLIIDRLQMLMARAIDRSPF